MEVIDKERLLEEFRQYLEALETLPGDASAEEPAPDLFSLFSELAALRAEVKAEARLFRGTLDDLRLAQGWLKDNQATLETTQERFSAELANLRRVALRPILLELLDLFDRLAAGSDALNQYRPVRGWIRIKSRPEDRRFIDSIRDGQAMTLRRLEETLTRQGVKAIEVTVGKPVDPHRMTVLELDRQPDLPSGIVTAELRKGFLWGDTTLRLSEVRANKP
jgi:molecular chaperone GrpE